MIKIVKGDILKVTNGIIAHQVNCQLKMGAGIALGIRNKWPKVYNEYISVHKNINDVDMLGTCHVVSLRHNRLYVANLFGQLHYGRDKQYTDYNALYNSLLQLHNWKELNQLNHLEVFIPYGMGCVNAGGEWPKVKTVIEDSLNSCIIVQKD